MQFSRIRLPPVVALQQGTFDQTYRTWAGCNEVERWSTPGGPLRLTAPVHGQNESLTESAMAYRAYAHAARNAGDAFLLKQGVPFVPPPAFAWSKLSLEDLNARLPEIRECAPSAVVSGQQSLSVRRTALDLCEAGRELERRLERDRTR